MSAERAGVALLGVGTAFGIWSATNTSPVGVVGFGRNHRRVAAQGIAVGLALVLAVAAAIWLIYRLPVAAGATAATGVALALWYLSLLHGRPE